MNKIKQRQVLKNKIRDIDSSLIDQSENSLFIVTTTLMTVKTHIFLMEQQNTYYQGPTFLSVNKSKPLKFIATAAKHSFFSIP